MANDPVPTDDISDREPNEERRMEGDFDESSTALWTLFVTLAKNHDNARINTLKDNMGGALIFVRPYSIHTYYGLGHADV